MAVIQFTRVKGLWRLRRGAMRLTLALVALSSSTLAIAQSAPPISLPVVMQPVPLPWLYRGSDIPPDAAWVFGELPNGLRYAVRKSGVPPKQISIRVAIDAGSLMEGSWERGYAHFNEHLAFRGSAYIADGEAKRVWQRLGATFGSDTNATTSPTQTVYKLDLPSATPESVNESLHMLQGMIAAPDIKPGAVDTEKRTIIAELREGAGPGQRVSEGVRATLYAGQRLGDANNAQEQASVGAATAHTLRMFHDRWYRPANTLVVMVGDMETDALEALIKRNFLSWRPTIQQAGTVDFGKPQMNAPRAQVIVEPGIATNVVLGVMRPWQPKNDTVAYNRDKQSLELAARLISRRLETRARAGASYLQAAVDYSDVLRTTNSTMIQITPVGNDWRRAVRDVRAVIADALTRPPTEAEIAREIEDYRSNLDAAVETETGQDDREIADTLVEAVNIRETVASAAVARDVFAGQIERLTPAALLKATRRIFAGTPLRGVLTLPAEEPGAQAKLLARDQRNGAAGPCRHRQGSGDRRAAQARRAGNGDRAQHIGAVAVRTRHFVQRHDAGDFRQRCREEQGLCLGALGRRAIGLPGGQAQSELGRRLCAGRGRDRRSRARRARPADQRAASGARFRPRR